MFREENTLAALEKDSVDCYGVWRKQTADKRRWTQIYGIKSSASYRFVRFNTPLVSPVFHLWLLLQRIGAWGSMVLMVLFFKNRSIKSAFICVHLRLNFSKAENGIPACAGLRRILILFMLFFLYDLRKIIIISISFDNLVLTGH